MRRRAKRVAFATLFGAMIFVTKTVMPSPIDKLFIIVHAILLALGSLLLRKMGATYVAVIGAVLTALWRTVLAPFTFFFALLYGLFVDGFFFLLKVDIVDGKVKTGRLVIAMTLSTILVGLLSYYITVHLVGLIPYNPSMKAIILVSGMISGAAAGYLASIIWNKHLNYAKL